MHEVEILVSQHGLHEFDLGIEVVFQRPCHGFNRTFLGFKKKAKFIACKVLT